MPRKTYNERKRRHRPQGHNPDWSWLEDELHRRYGWRTQPPRTSLPTGQGPTESEGTHA